MNILLLGSGAREHAIAAALIRTDSTDSIALTTMPGNPGTAQLGENVDGDILDGSAVVRIAKERGIDLVIVGPEAPLVAGVADDLREAGFVVFGPSRAAAQLEGSKAFAKEVMAAAGVPTARAYICETAEEAIGALDAFAPPYVVKDDGLAGGKGVVVTEDRDQAEAHARACLDKRSPGEGRVVIEEFLTGREVSLFCVSDGARVLPLEPAQDFKRLADGDAGPNTGGMGAYSPLPWAGEHLSEIIVERVAQPVIDELARRGTPFVGLLYCGLAVDGERIRVVEFNARFGDPETQSVLARLRTPLAEVLAAAARGDLRQAPPLLWDPRAAVTVVLAAPGYPNKVTVGDPVLSVARAQAHEGVEIIHAGTAVGADGMLRSAGGRVLSVVGLGEDMAQARRRAYQAIGEISLTGGHYRRDIAQRAADDEAAARKADAADAADAGDAADAAGDCASEEGVVGSARAADDQKKES